MFLDIREFTTFAEGKRPEEVIAYLNTLWELLVDVVNQHHGIVNKFLGDGFMATFGAPLAEGNNCRNALNWTTQHWYTLTMHVHCKIPPSPLSQRGVRGDFPQGAYAMSCPNLLWPDLEAAQEIVATIEHAVAEGRCPPTRIGIGLHAGEAVAGNVGSATRKEYTIIGDVVNLASRIEAMNKEFESTLLCSREVVDGVEASLPMLTPLGTVSIRGHKQPVELLRLC